MLDQTMGTPVQLPTKLLAVFSAGLFWCVPFSPLLSIAAIKATDQASGWPRHVARGAAMMTIGWVALLTVALAWMLYVIIWNPSLA